MPKLCFNRPVGLTCTFVAGPSPLDNSRKYLDPEVLSGLRGLDLKARLIVEGYVSGMHRSPYHGFSVEFAEHREYSPGDDLRYVDWKVFGRSDRYFLKQYDEETNFNCHLLLDTSESMTYRSESAAVTKLEYGQYIAAALAWLVVQQQDAVGIGTFDSEVRSLLAPASQSGHLKHVFHALDSATGTGETSVGSILSQFADRIRKRGLIILISDLFDDPEQIERGLRHLKHRRHDVSVLQLIDPAEQDFPFEGPTLFRGLEGFPDQFSEPRALRDAYRAEFDSFVKGIGGVCRKLGFDHTLVRTDNTMDVALSAFLQRRSGSRR